MTQPPIIGIVANERLNKALDNIPWTYVPTGFVTAVQEVGGIPYIIPMTCDDNLLAHYIQMVDKLILIGGQNVNPALYGQEKAAYEDDYSDQRDDCELKLIELAKAHKKPLFTVCRGTQLVNVAFGGDLHQDIASHWQEELPHVTTHSITVTKESALAEIYGPEAQINSYHRQAIDTLADGLKVVARAEDNTIEAIESSDPSFRYLGVQWHPELLHDSSPLDRRLFHYVVNKL